MSTVLTKPQFFKPLISGFEDDFSIPVSFFKYLKGEECDRAKLRSQGGKLWPIKINGRRFEDGWKHFVEDHDLQIGDFLVFRHEGDMVFDVLVFDRTTCQREYLPIIDIKEEEFEIHDQNRPKYTSTGKKLEKEKKVKTGLKETDSSSAHEHPYCVIKLSPDSIRKSRLYIPRNFATLCGLYGRSCSMILKDEEEKCWPVKLLYRTLESKFFIGAGWGAFHDFHKLKEGDALIIELIKNGETPVMKIFRLQEHPEVTREHTIQINEPACSEHTEVRRELKFQSNAQAGSPSLEHLHANSKASKLRKSQLETPEVAKESDAGVKDRLLTNVDRQRRHLTESGTCSRCRGHMETLCHALRDCLNSQKIWEGVLPAHTLPPFMAHSAIDWFSEGAKGKLLANMEHGDIFFALICHHIWKWRNDELFAKKTTFIPDLLNFFSKKLSVILQSSKGEPLGNPSPAKVVHLVGWSKPIEGVVKLNTDGSCLSNGRIAAGGVLRDAGGAWLAGFTHNLGLGSAFSAELWGILSGKNLEKENKVITRLERKASSSVPEHPYCIIKLSPDSLKKSRLYIPRNFARLCGLYGRSCSMILKDEEEKCWPAKLLYRTIDNKFIIGAGWGAFHEVHKLKAGDTLIIELIKDGETPVMKICRVKEHPEVTTEQTFHNNGPACSGLQEHPEVRRESNAQAGSPALRHLHSNTKALELRKSQLETPEVAKESCSGKPKKYKQHENASKAKASSSSVTPNSFFVARITDYTCKRSKLYIPVKFSRLHFENKKCCKVILVDQEGRSWPAYSWHKSSVEEAYISDGWKEFSDANKLKMGDSFVFEFVGTQKRPVLQMRGFKANHKAGKNQEAASSSMEKPYTYVTVQASHVKMSQIKIPVSFAKRCGLITNKCSAVTIKNETGNSWLVALRLDKNDEVYMAYGWLDFVKENGIQEGDVFMLELVKEGIKPQLKYYALKEEMGSNRKGILEDFEDVEPTILRS
ncbi:uncharacterized protein [Euphorbia lathyris]|uniref:uncharacterized protein isoform X2 n=1 Tax=Euphorbia lathyris TaxID=212925 RepID=UPI0033135DBB